MQLLGRFNKFGFGERCDHCVRAVDVEPKHHFEGMVVFREGDNRRAAQNDVVNVQVRGAMGGVETRLALSSISEE